MQPTQQQYTVQAAESESLSPFEKGRLTTIARGETLEQDASRITPYADRPGIYECAKPEGAKLKPGCALWYDVDVCNQECQCAAYQRHGTCKHLVAVNRAIARATELLSPMLPVSQSAAAAVYGTSRGFESREAYLAAREADFS